MTLAAVTGFLLASGQQACALLGLRDNVEIFLQQEDGTFKFDPAFILVDGWGIMRAEYRTAAPEVDLIMRDIDLVTTEARNSTGAARYAYEAAHLFVCYPR